MKGNIEERACRLALYIIENRATVRAAARQFGISKSTVHIEVIKWIGFYGQYNKTRDPLLFRRKRQFKQRLVREECLCQTIRV